MLNRDCRTHDVDNLFVVDSGFFPSLPVMNPALTIAANDFVSHRRSPRAVCNVVPSRRDSQDRNTSDPESSAMTTNKLTGGQKVVDMLIREGVEKVFAIPGHGNTALLDAFVDRADEIEVMPAMHEQGAAHMADGYYRASGKIAVRLHLDRPRCDQHADRPGDGVRRLPPLLLITGAVHTYMENRGVLQEIDRPHGNNFPRMAEPVVKRWWQPHRVDQIPTVLAQAFNTMLDGAAGRC